VADTLNPPLGAATDIPTNCQKQVYRVSGLANIQVPQVRWYLVRIFIRGVAPGEKTEKTDFFTNLDNFFYKFK